MLTRPSLRQSWDNRRVTYVCEFIYYSLLPVYTGNVATPLKKMLLNSPVYLTRTVSSRSSTLSQSKIYLAARGGGGGGVVALENVKNRTPLSARGGAHLTKKVKCKCFYTFFSPVEGGPAPLLDPPLVRSHDLNNVV